MPIFERFIRYEWAERALELAVQNQSPSLLRPWLEGQGLRGDSSRRTANIITWLWFPKDKSAQYLQQEALNLFPQLTLKERRALHWGMALFVFPNFRQTAQICGRLLRLQGEFYKQDVIGRVLEHHSNQTTMRRATERVLQTITDWGLLSISEKVYRPCPPETIGRPELCSWLLMGLLANAPEKFFLLSDLSNSGEFFPFSFSDFERVLHENPVFSLHRNSSGDEVVGLSHFDLKENVVFQK
ncbi:hypothetical protein [Bellilinea sp.]|uniref:hypothetical protein n=1 Tax=Bellilinea sp. TaxID=2838785 RepID=UPI002ADE196A|nr:hypothetical protein [Bellilinea sp.]